MKKNRLPQRIEYRIEARSLPSETEELASALYEACKHSARLHRSGVAPAVGADCIEEAARSGTISHNPAYIVQSALVKLLYSSEFRTGAFACEIDLSRRALDTIAWHVFGMELANIRRLYRGLPRVALPGDRTFEEYSHATRLMKEHPSSIAIACDLTTVLQVGDVVWKNGTDVSLIETKSPSVSLVLDDGREAFKSDSSQFAPESASRQAERERISRQVGRLEHVANVLNGDASMDPDTKIRQQVGPERIMVRSWYPILSCLLNRCITEGHATALVDGCLHVGCFSPNARGGRPFAEWRTSMEDIYASGSNLLALNMYDHLHEPLSIPIFGLPLPKKHILDILYGRAFAYAVLCPKSWIAHAKHLGVNLRTARNKQERRLASRFGRDCFRTKNNESIFVEIGGKAVLLQRGIALRSLLCGQRPESIIRQYVLQFHKLL